MVELSTEELFPGAHGLPVQARLVSGLRREVERSQRWRWLELGCSLAAGRGDTHSDVDVGVGYADGLSLDEVVPAGTALVEAVGDVRDLLVHKLPSWPDDTRRFAVEYHGGGQLDLVVAPAGNRRGLPDGAIAVVDKDATLAIPWRPAVADPPAPAEAREWTMLAWWLLSDVAKYLRRGSLFEAAERVAEARQLALRLFAVGRRIPYPSFGLVSLLDVEPAQLPGSLARTYCRPDTVAEVAAAADATAVLLAEAAAAAGQEVGAGVETPWSTLARQRLAAVR